MGSTEEEEVRVLSDVHANGLHSSQGHDVVSRFVCDMSGVSHGLQHRQVTATGLATDADGDLTLARADRPAQHAFQLHHAMGTALSGVGLQVWSGSLLLCDFIVASLPIFAHANLLELGGGTGLASLVASRLRGGPVFCTDSGREVLKNCQRNARENMCPVWVRELDFTRPETWIQESCWCEREDCVLWHARDKEQLDSRPLVLLAADVLYDDDLTDALAHCLHSLLGRTFGDEPPVLYLTLEKRINFTVEHMAAHAPAYERAIAKIFRDPRFVSERIPTESLGRHMQYSRTPQMELWRIRSAAL